MMYIWIFIALIHAFPVTDSEVLTLTDTDFENKIANHEFALVHFFTPGCAQCEKLVPELELASEVLKSDRPAVFLAQVDCARSGKNTCENYEVNAFPTLKFFKDGKKGFNYEGPTDPADSIIKYVRSLVRPLTAELLSIEDLESFTDHPENSVIGFDVKGFKSREQDDYIALKKKYLRFFAEKDSLIFERYQFFASTLNDRYRFGHTFDIAVRNHYGFNNTVFIYRSKRLKTTFEPDQLEYTGVYSPYKMRDWCLANIHGLVGHRTPENAIDFKFPLVVLFYDVDYVKNAKASNYWRNRAMKVAKKFSENSRRMSFAVSSALSFGRELANDLGLTVEASPEKPIVVGYDEAGLKYIMESQFTAEDLEQFAENLLLGKLKPRARPQTASSSADNIKDALVVLRGSHSAEEAGNLSVLLPEVAKLVCLALTIPVTSCTAERSFSTIRILKTYLRSTMSQNRLNHVALLHIHKSLCEELDTNAVADEFIRRCSVRRNTFIMQK